MNEYMDYKFALVALNSTDISQWKWNN